MVNGPGILGVRSGKGWICLEAHLFSPFRPFLVEKRTNAHGTYIFVYKKIRPTYVQIFLDKQSKKGSDSYTSSIVFFRNKLSSH